MRYTEDQLQSWTVPLSTSEEQRVENTIRMIKDAVSAHDYLRSQNIEIFTQGSYANNTNVRQNSDVDVCLMLTSSFWGNYVAGRTAADYGFSNGGLPYETYKAYVIEALQRKFGSTAVKVGNKCINVSSNSYRVNADVVPALQYRDYAWIGSLNPAQFSEGIRYIAKDGTYIVNYPKEHILNGKEKNIKTNHSYKKLVRIMKHLRNSMVDIGLADGNTISSFLIECLVWNIPNSIIIGYSTWIETVQNAIVYLWGTLNNNREQELVEVSNHFPLFSSGRKWSPQNVKSFLQDMYSFLQF